MSIPTNLTKEFVDFVKSIGESKTKQEEDLIVVREIGTLKNTIMDNKSTDVGGDCFQLTHSARSRRTCFV